MPWVKAWVKEGAVRCKDCETEVTAARQAIIEESARIREMELDHRAARAGVRPVVDPRRLFIFYARNMVEEKMTLQDLADHLGIGKERVRQLEKDVMRRMRAAYGHYRREHKSEDSNGTL